MNELSCSIGSTSVPGNDFGQSICERLTLALPVQTSPTAHLHLDRHGEALHWKILEIPEISAVPAGRLRVASRTGAHSRPYGSDHPAIAVSLRPNNPRVKSRGPICVLSHAPDYRQRRRAPNSTESEAGPAKMAADKKLGRFGVLIKRRGLRTSPHAHPEGLPSGASKPSQKAPTLPDRSCAT
jgi:hypothetical protein